MSSPMGGGANVGTARGTIELDISQLERAAAQARSLGQMFERALNGVNTPAQRTQNTINSLGRDLLALGGITSAVALARQFAQFAIQADATATAYRRQGVAALDLAGSQGKLNELIAEYNESTGNQIDRAQALADVTRLQAIGFADTAQELESFTIAARGASLALGKTQDYIIGQLQLAIANQSKMRLDQIGLGVEEVEARIKSLRDANSSLTTAQAYQNAVLGLLTEKYGALAKSTEAQATGAEKAAKAWKDLQLQFGEVASSPIDTIMSTIARQLDLAAAGLRSMARDMDYLQKQVAKEAPPNSWLAMLLLGGVQASGMLPLITSGAPRSSLEENVLRGQIRNVEDTRSRANEGLAAARTRGDSAEVERFTGIVRQATLELSQLKAALLLASGAAKQLASAPDIGSYARPNATGRIFTTEQTSLIRQWAADVQSVEREAGQARVDATRQYEQQRADVISDYGRTVAREEQDFARNRLRALQDYAKQVADAQADIAENEAEAARDYAKAVADVREEASKRESKWQRDYSERIAELRTNSNERLLELEANYAKARERAELDHRDRLMSAAARLDATGVFEEQKAYARQQQDAKDNYEDQRAEISKALKEQLADQLQAQQERLEEARAGDAERLADMQEAFEQQRAETRADAARRLADMQADFEERLAREDEDRAVQNQRRAEDHAAQMAQMAAAQAERMAQINEQATKEKKALDDKFVEELAAAGLHNEQWLKIQTERQKQSLALFNQFWDEIDKRFAVQGPKTKAATPSAWPQSFADGGWVQRSGMAMVHAGEFVVPASQARAMAGGMSRNITIGDIVVHGAPGMDTNALALAVRREIVAALEEVA